MIIGDDDRTPADYSSQHNKLVTKNVRFLEDNSIQGVGTGITVTPYQ